MKLVPATKTNHFLRVIGTVDVLGNGTHHSVAEVGPFVLMDDAVAALGQPPFGRHPHRGLHVISLIWEGSVRSHMSHEESVVCAAPCAVSVYAGKGMSHEEVSASPRTVMQQLIFRIPAAARFANRATSRVCKSTFETVAPGVEALVALGSLFGRQSEIRTDVKINVAMLRLAPAASVRIPVFASGGCFVYAAESEVQAAETKVAEKDLAILEQDLTEIVVANKSAKEAKIVFANGERIDEPWVKLLTQNGFIIEKDEAEAKRQEEIIKKVGLEDYGQE